MRYHIYIEYLHSPAIRMPKEFDDIALATEYVMEENRKIDEVWTGDAEIVFMFMVDTETNQWSTNNKTWRPDFKP